VVARRTGSAPTASWIIDPQRPGPPAAAVFPITGVIVILAADLVTRLIYGRIE